MLLIDGSGCEEDPAEAPEDPELNRGLVLTVLGSSSTEAEEDEFVVGGEEDSSKAPPFPEIVVEGELFPFPVLFAAAPAA